jgi:hypothetical protein
MELRLSSAASRSSARPRTHRSSGGADDDQGIGRLETTVGPALPGRTRRPGEVIMQAAYLPHDRQTIVALLRVVDL